MNTVDLVEALRGQEWMEQAACRGMGTHYFYPDRGDQAAGKKARETCGGCPVKKECLDYAVSNDEENGIWGGASERAGSEGGLREAKKNRRAA